MTRNAMSMASCSFDSPDDGRAGTFCVGKVLVLTAAHCSLLISMMLPGASPVVLSGVSEGDAGLGAAAPGSVLAYFFPLIFSSASKMGRKMSVS